MNRVLTDEIHTNVLCSSPHDHIFIHVCAYHHLGQYDWTGHWHSGSVHRFELTTFLA